MQEIRTNGHYFGGEPSGHFIFKDDSLIGDGMSTALRVLTIMMKENKKLSELKKGLDLLKVVEINQRIDVVEEQVATMTDTVKSNQKGSLFCVFPCIGFFREDEQYCFKRKGSFQVTSTHKYERNMFLLKMSS